MKRVVIVIGVIAVGVTGCVTNPSNRDGEETKVRNGGVGESVTCVKPPPEVLTSGLEAKLDTSVYKLGQIVNADISAGQKIEKIRETLPEVQSFEVLEYRFCRMYTNGLIDKPTYNELVRQVLPSFKSQAKPAPATDAATPTATLPKVEFKVISVDDKIKIKDDGKLLHEGRTTDWLPVDVHPGKNQIEIEVFNQESWTGGVGLFGGHKREGWNYAVTFRSGANEWAYRGGEDEPPAERFDAWFGVQNLILNVDPEKGTATMSPK